MLFREVTFNEWKPASSKGHENVDFWSGNHPSTIAVRGWLFWRLEAGRFNFVSHSVIEENGTLIDITPIGGNMLHKHLLFLQHLGSDEEFEAIKKCHSCLVFPPFSNAEFSSVSGELEENASEDMCG